MPNAPCPDIAAVRTMLSCIGHVMWNYFDAKENYA